MYTKDPVLILPADQNQTLWRYQDLAKLLSLIQTSKLFFCRVDHLDDPFEGSITKQTEKARLQIHKEISTAYPIPQNGFTELMKGANITLREWTYVNCWHMNKFESAGMWKLYANDIYSVAIRSSLNRLINAFSVNNLKVCIGQISYVDYELAMIPEGHAFSRIVHKRLSFEHEKELRAIILLRENGLEENDSANVLLENGILVSVNLKTLIEQIYISPLAPKWFAETAKKAINNAGFNCEILHSKLNEDPIY